MGKTIIYIVLLAVVGAAVYFFVFKQQKTAFSGDEAGFTIADTAAISKIFMADKQGNSVLLERKAGVWKLNNKYAVLAAPVQVLLTTLHTQVPMSPVPKNAHNDIIKQLAGGGIKVEVYNKDGKAMHIFYVGGQAHDNAGAYMLTEGAQRPYIVQIPGFPGYITPRYSTNVEDWRDRTVFSIPADQLRSVSIQYADTGERYNDFILKQDDAGKITVEGEPLITNGKTLNERRSTVFKKFFEKVYCEGFINGTIKLDSVIASTDKRCTITAIAKNGNKQQVDVYWMPINKRSKNMLTPSPNSPSQYDADRFYAVMNNFQDTAIVQRVSFDKLFRKAYEFYEADAGPEHQKIDVPKNAGNVIISGK